MNKVEKIKAEIERLKNELVQEAEKSYKSEFDEGRISAFEDMITFIDSLEEESVSNDLEEESKKYSSCIYLEEVLSDGDKEVLKERLINTFKAGAQWQKQQDQSTIELAEDHAYLAGQEKIIEKACVWLNNFYSEDRHCYLIKEDIDNFKKAMEE